MFSYFDIDTLNAVNAINKDLKMTNFELSFPAKEEYDIPDDLVQLSIFEGHIDRGSRDFEAFKIYVGHLTTVRRICNAKSKGYIFENDILSKAGSVDDPLVYFDSEDGTSVVFAKPLKGDIVVGSIKELREALDFISTRFAQVRRATDSVRRFSTKTISGKIK